MKEKIRPVYSEIQGYFSVAEDTNFITEETLWNKYNESIQELNEITKKDYNKFLLSPKNEYFNGRNQTCLRGNVYRSTISGLINRLHGEYFADERHPFSGTPSTIINQSQNQNQSIELLFEFRDEIDEKIKEAPEGSKEKTFLEKIKDGLSSIKNYSQLVALILRVGNELGFTIQEIMKLFNK